MKTKKLDREIQMDCERGSLHVMARWGVLRLLTSGDPEFNKRDVRTLIRHLEKYIEKDEIGLR